MISRLGKCDDPEVVQEARKRFKDHCDGIDKLSGDLRNAVMYFFYHFQFWHIIQTHASKLRFMELCYIMVLRRTWNAY